MKKGMKLPELSLSCDSKTAVAKFEVFSCGLLLARTRGLNIPGQEGNFDHCGSCGSLSLPRKGIFPKLQGKGQLWRRQWLRQRDTGQRPNH
jgi:hypothetical protein